MPILASIEGLINSGDGSLIKSVERASREGVRVVLSLKRHVHRVRVHSEGLYALGVLRSERGIV
jgi:hypothetical protein